MQKFGIDVSRYQGDINLGIAKSEGVEFVIVRCGGSDDAYWGRYVDPKFERNYAEAKAKGLPVGAFFITYAMTVEDSIKDAEFIYQNALKGKKFEYPIYLDIEIPKQLQLGRRKLTDIALAFCRTLEEKGMFVGIYAGGWVIDSHMYPKEIERYTKWIASYTDKCYYRGKYDMWQFGGDTNLLRSNKIAGVITDQNYCYRDFPSEIINSGKNGFPKVVKECGVITGVNIPRTADSLIVYTDSKSTTGTNQYGTDVIVDRNGIVVDIIVGKANTKIDKGHKVYSGHGINSEWLQKRVRKGYLLWAENGKLMISTKQHRSVTAVNGQRLKNGLVVWNKGMKQSNAFGRDVKVISNIATTEAVYGKTNVAVPVNGYILTGHGTSADWLKTYIKKGVKVSFNGKYITLG